MSESQAVILSFITALNQAGNSSDPWSLLHDNVKVKIAGTTPLSGYYPGRRLIEGILVNTTLEYLRSLHIEISEFVGQEQRVATLLTITGETVEGDIFNQKKGLFGCVFEVCNNLIMEIDLLPDTMLVEKELFNRRFVGNG